jgi:thiol:disulfide interchange protein DsbC
MFRFFVLAMLLAGATCARADDDPAKAATDALHALAPKAKIDSVTESSLPGFYAALVEGHVIYVSADGKYLIDGKVYDVAKHRDLNDERMAGVRKDGVERIPQDKRIVFAPKDPKYRVTVFTDVDCPYCRQFHKEIAEYNRLGIEVDYVLFPLSIHPGADKKAQTVWCAKDRNAAYTEAMNGQNLATKTCDNPIAEVSSIAMSIGLNGTPAILADDGSQLGGYLAPKDLAERLDALGAPAHAGAK